MENLIKLKVEYQLNDDYLKIRTKYREQIISLFLLHQLTGEVSNELVESYLEIVAPLPMSRSHHFYNSVSVQRCNKRKHFNWLIKEYLDIKSSKDHVA